jgi:selenide,water dikinase
MGGRPIMALALVGMPLEKLPVSVIRQCSTAASRSARGRHPVAGGHSIDTLEPIYGLVALGLVHPDKVKRNSSARRATC